MKLRGGIVSSQVLANTKVKEALILVGSLGT